MSSQIEALWETGLTGSLKSVNDHLSKSLNSTDLESCPNCGSQMNNYSACAICPQCGHKDCGGE